MAPRGLNFNITAIWHRGVPYCCDDKTVIIQQSWRAAIREAGASLKTVQQHSNMAERG